jgi:hypothetical protein
VTLVLDAGALVAVERGDREVIALIKRERLANRAPLTHGGIVGQVWRGGRGRQARLGQLLPGLEVAALDRELGRRAGSLLGTTRTSDVMDAAIALLTSDGDDLLTSDAADLRPLVAAVGVHAEIIEV